MRALWLRRILSFHRLRAQWRPKNIKPWLFKTRVFAPLSVQHWICLSISETDQCKKDEMRKTTGVKYFRNVGCEKETILKCFKCRYSHGMVVYSMNFGCCACASTFDSVNITLFFQRQADCDVLINTSNGLNKWCLLKKRCVIDLQHPDPDLFTISNVLCSNIRVIFFYIHLKYKMKNPWLPQIACCSFVIFIVWQIFKLAHHNASKHPLSNWCLCCHRYGHLLKYLKNLFRLDPTTTTITFFIFILREEQDFSTLTQCVLS